jgi:two-component system, chemotaxis family, protein-glutamate methylesterase/glutaminase
MLLRKEASSFSVRVKTGPHVCRQRPSVDVLFKSVAECVGSRAVAALLTGMGRDGAEGLLAIRQAGGYTVAQNEETCVVYGMPAEAVKMGAACSVLPLDGIAEALLGRDAVRNPPAG